MKKGRNFMARVVEVNLDFMKTAFNSTADGDVLHHPLCAWCHTSIEDPPITLCCNSRGILRRSSGDPPLVYAVTPRG